MDTNWKEASVTYFKIPSRHWPAGIKEKQKQLQKGELVSLLVFKVGTSGCRSSSVTGRVMVRAVNRQPPTTKIQVAS